MKPKVGECSHSKGTEKRGKRRTTPGWGRGTQLPGPAVGESRRKHFTKSLMQICFVTCVSAGGIKGIQVLHLTFSQGTEPLSLFCIVLSSGSPKASPLSQWSSTDPRILLLMSCCTNPTHTAGLSAHTLVLLETFILKKEKRKRTKNESNLSDYVSAAELPVKKKSQHMCSCFSVYTRIYCEEGT